MNVTQYLQRLRYEGARTPDVDTLHALQRAHMLAVPFENSDIHARRKIVLTVNTLFDKIVKRRRGGICYELNSAFAALLVAMGFDVTLLAAEVYRDDGSVGPAFDHMLLRVTIDGKRFLTDVGFGDSFITPLLLDERGPQYRGDIVYHLREEADVHILTKQKASSAAPMAPSLRFTTAPRSLSDFDAMCYHHQTSDQSHFTRKEICSIATVNGRISISGSQLIVTVGDTKTITDLHTQQEKNQALQRYFDLSA